jgi:hypothetical protein
VENLLPFLIRFIFFSLLPLSEPEVVAAAKAILSGLQTRGARHVAGAGSGQTTGAGKRFPPIRGGLD